MIKQSGETNLISFAISFISMPMPVTGDVCKIVATFVSLVIYFAYCLLQTRPFSSLCGIKTCFYPEILDHLEQALLVTGCSTVDPNTMP